MSRFTLSEPSTAAITNLRRRAITLPGSSSSFLVNMLRNACARDGLGLLTLGLSCGGADPGVSDVEFAILSPLNTQTVRPRGTGYAAMDRARQQAHVERSPIT